MENMQLVWRCSLVSRANKQVISTISYHSRYDGSSKTNDDYEPDDPKWGLTRKTRQHTSLMTENPSEVKDLS